MNDASKENALIAIIRAINEEVKRLLPSVKQKDMCKKENMDVILSIIGKHKETVRLLGFTHHQFIYRMGVMNGVYKDRD